jgi:hypothetical protein
VGKIFAMDFGTTRDLVGMHLLANAELTENRQVMLGLRDACGAYAAWTHRWTQNRRLVELELLGPLVFPLSYAAICRSSDGRPTKCASVGIGLEACCSRDAQRFCARRGGGVEPAGISGNLRTPSGMTRVWDTPQAKEPSLTLPFRG